MIVKLLKPWRHWEPDYVFACMQENIAEYLISEGIGERIEAKKEEPSQQPKPVHAAAQNKRKNQ